MAIGIFAYGKVPVERVNHFIGQQLGKKVYTDTEIFTEKDEYDLHKVVEKVSEDDFNAQFPKGRWSYISMKEYRARIKYLMRTWNIPDDYFEKVGVERDIIKPLREASDGTKKGDYSKLREQSNGEAWNKLVDQIESNGVTFDVRQPNDYVVVKQYTDFDDMRKRIVSGMIANGLDRTQGDALFGKIKDDIYRAKQTLDKYDRITAYLNIVNEAHKWWDTAQEKKKDRDVKAKSYKNRPSSQSKIAYDKANEDYQKAGKTAQKYIQNMNSAFSNLPPSEQKSEEELKTERSATVAKLAGMVAKIKATVEEAGCVDCVPSK